MILKDGDYQRIRNVLNVYIHWLWRQNYTWVIPILSHKIIPGCQFKVTLEFWLCLNVCGWQKISQKSLHSVRESLKTEVYSTYACNVWNVLYQFGFGVLWEVQRVENLKLLLKNSSRGFYIALNWHGFPRLFFQCMLEL